MAQQNITTLQSNINSQIADNTSGDISAADVRDNLINMTDSLLFNSGSQGITGSLNITENLIIKNASYSQTTGSIDVASNSTQAIPSLILRNSDNTAILKISESGNDNVQIDLSGGGTNHLTISADGKLNLYSNTDIIIIESTLPTSEPAISGQLWLSGSAGSNSKILCVRN